MSNAMNKILIASIVKKAIKEISYSPERGIRNIVDLATQFTKGRFQKEFFCTAQKMLENPDSCYYKLIPDVINNVEHERLMMLGMNVGFNSCTAGAKTIRDIEKRDGHNIPWCITLEINPDVIKRNKHRYYYLISQGSNLGIYTYILCCEQITSDILELCKKYTDCTFIIICKPSEITQEFVTSTQSLKNIMPVLEYNETDLENACEMLRKNKYLYSVYYRYNDTDLVDIINDTVIKKTERLHPLFTVFIADNTCSQDSKYKTYDHICKTRNNQAFTTVAWDYHFDTRFVDSIISDDFCTVIFDSKGNILLDNIQNKYNFFDTELKSILLSMFSK